MSNKIMKELMNLSKDELATKRRELEAQLFDARIKKVTGQLENTALPWKFRKQLARVKTLETKSLTTK